MADGVRRWERGRDTVDELLKRNELQRVSPDQPAALRMIEISRTHLVTAAQIRDSDPTMAMAAAYDAARKALVALLETQGGVPRI